MRNFIYLLSLTIASFLFALFTGGEIIYYIFFALSSLLFLCLLYILAASASVKLQIDVENHIIHVGEKLKYKIKLRNKGFFHILFIVVDDKNPGLLPVTTNLKPFGKKAVKRIFESKRRGIYKIGPVTVKIRDPFGILEIKKTFKTNHKITVYPFIYNIAVKLPAMTAIGNTEVKNRSYEDYTNLSNLREYVDGDSLKKVHWRISAKKQKLYVKEYEYTASNEVYMLWDLDKAHYADDYNGVTDERSAECMLSLAKYCLINDVPVNLVDYETRKILIRGKSIKDFDIFKTSTLSIFPVFSYDFNDFIIRCLKSIPYDSTIAIITPHVDDSTINGLSNIRIHRDLMIFYTDKNLIDQRLRDKLEKLNVKFIQWGVKDASTNKKEVQYI